MHGHGQRGSGCRLTFFFSFSFSLPGGFFVVCVHVVSRDPPCWERRLMASATRHVCSSGEGGRGDGAGGVNGEHTPRLLGLAYHTTFFLHMSMPEVSLEREPRGPLCSRPAPERRGPPCADHSVGVLFTNRSLPHPPVAGVARATGGEGSTHRRAAATLPARGGQVEPHAISARQRRPTPLPPRSASTLARPPTQSAWQVGLATLTCQPLPTLPPSLFPL